MLPLMLLGDGDLDFTTLFLLSNTMQQDCVHSTDDQMMMYMPLLLGGVSSCNLLYGPISEFCFDFPIAIFMNLRNRLYIIF